MRACYICTQTNKAIDWKNAELLRRFMSPENKILSKRMSHCCAKHQRGIAKAIKRAREMGIVPYTPLIEK